MCHRVLDSADFTALLAGYRRHGHAAQLGGQRADTQASQQHRPGHDLRPGTGIQHNPGISKQLAAKAQVELAGGIPFLSDKDLKTALDKAGVPPKTATAIVDENANARINGLRVSLSLLAVVALISVFFCGRIPTQQPSAAPVSNPSA